MAIKSVSRRLSNRSTWIPKSELLEYPSLVFFKRKYFDIQSAAHTIYLYMTDPEFKEHSWDADELDGTLTNHPYNMDLTTFELGKEV
jgi:hypothetical protein